jgi:hypothetical protein
VDDHARADKRRALLVDQTCHQQSSFSPELTTWQQVERIADLLALWVLDHNGMTCIVSTGAPRTDIRLSREDIHQFSFPFITPLCTQPIISVHL